MKKIINYTLLVLLVFTGIVNAQVGTETMNVNSTFVPSVNDATKLLFTPEIKDSSKRITNFKYGISSKPMFADIQTLPIDPAKMVNEPLAKLYRFLLKAGYGTYNMPYGELFYNSLRSKDLAYGAHASHLSALGNMKDVGFPGWSDTKADAYIKKFYKKHTLSGDISYTRNANHFYGYDIKKDTINDKKFTFQRFQNIDAKINLVSYFTDSSDINYNVDLNYYNYLDKYGTVENNVMAQGLVDAFISGESFHTLLKVDYYNDRFKHDTINNTIISLNPTFTAESKMWKAKLGIMPVIDVAGDSKFYFYPQIDFVFNVSNHFILPYAGLNGGLTRNSFKSLSQENPFIQSEIDLQNTSKYVGYLGLKGSLSSALNYDLRGSFNKFNNMNQYVIDENMIALKNKYKIIYDDVQMINVSGQMMYQSLEKIKFIVKGNFYDYKIVNDNGSDNVYFKPNYDFTFSTIYNLKSKLIATADLFVLGKQWTKGLDGAKDHQIDGFADVNLGVEYRYSKMLSGFIKFNNIANMRYYRYDKYPTQRFNLMAGITFVF